MSRGNYRGNRGGNNGGHRPRGGNRGIGRGFGRGRGRGEAPSIGLDVADFQVQMWPENGGNGYDSRRGSLTPRGRGRGYRGQRGSAPISGRSTPRGNGARGRGHAGIGSPTHAKQPTKPKLGPDAPLSSLLYESRPLLRPIVFVKSTKTPYLFQQEEELLKPTVEEAQDTEAHHMPTADRVAQVFSGSITIDSGPEDDGEEELEEIDFNDTKRLLEVQAKPVKKFKEMMVEEQFTGYNKRTTSPPAPPIMKHEKDDSQTITQSSVDTVNDRIAEMSISLGPEATLETAPDVVGVAMSAQEPTIVTKENEMLSAPALDTQMSDDILSQGRPINDKAESEVGTTVAHNETELKTATMSTPLPSDAGAQDPDINEELMVERELLETVAKPIETAKAASFFIDTAPSPISTAEQRPAEPTTSQILGVTEALEDDEEVIVYVAPHPRLGRTTPAIPSFPTASSALPTTSILTGLSAINESTKVTSSTFINETTPIPSSSTASASLFAETRNPRQFVSPSLLATPSAQRKTKLRVRMYEARLARRKKAKHSMFSFGAARQEMDWQEPKGRDPKWEQRRRGDSDIDWGDDDDDNDTQGEGGTATAPVSGADGMDLDPELRDEKSMEALGSFADGMLSQEGSRFVTMDDVADIEKLKMEDEASDGAKGSSGDEDSDNEEEEESDGDDEDADVDAMLEKEEEKMIAEADEIELSDDSDDGLSPRSSFEARLKQIRNRAKKRADTLDISQYAMEDEDEDEDEFDEGYRWEEYNEDFFAHIEDVIEENPDILTKGGRKERKRLFRAISNGDFDEFSTVARRKKDKPDIPLFLQEQWEMDRVKKAERKIARELAKLELAADPLVKKKGGKKSRKAMLAAARLGPRITVIGPNRVIDMTTLVQQIRRFLADPDGPQTMSLPPANKHSRKLIHEMAVAFNLNSKSNGREGARYTTLIRTSRSGLYVDERMVTNIVRRSHGGEFYAGEGGGERNGKGKGKQYGPLRQKEGEEVGKAAPKIDSSNLGFKMLEAMGWSEGKRIGVTGGLDKPLTAIIKHSKLGLGATK